MHYSAASSALQHVDDFADDLNVGEILEKIDHLVQKRNDSVFHEIRPPVQILIIPQNSQYNKYSTASFLLQEKKRKSTKLF